MRLTKRALDAEESVVLSSISRSVVSGFSCGAETPSTPALVVELVETPAGTPLAPLGGGDANRWAAKQQSTISWRNKVNHKDVLIDMLQHFAFGLHRTIKDLPKEALQWQPDLEANNIAVTVWHICRALDLLKVKILENLPDQKQIWYAKNWASRTNYDPTGLGVAGFGNLAGYTLEQVKEVPILSAGESLEYFDQVYEALNDYLMELELEALEKPPIGWPGAAGESPENVYDVLLMFLMDTREHLGEIKAIKAMWNRKREKSSLQNV